MEFAAFGHDGGEFGFLGGVDDNGLIDTQQQQMQNKTFVKQKIVKSPNHCKQEVEG